MNEKLWETIRKTTSTLRDSNPDINVPESLLPSRTDTVAAMIETPSNGKTSQNLNGVPAANTTEYRRTMDVAQIKATIASPPQSPHPEEDLIDLTEDGPNDFKSPMLSPLESMWNLDALNPSLLEIDPLPAQLFPMAVAENTFHTVRGPSARNRTNAHRAPRSVSRHTNNYYREPKVAEETGISSQTAPRSVSRHTNNYHRESKATEDAGIPSPNTPTVPSISSQPSLPISISPKQIRYTSPCDHEQTESLAFTNNNPFPVTYKISTTRPQSYAVRPNFGTLLSGQRVMVQFILMEILEAGDVGREQAKRRDRFRVQSVPVQDVAHGSMFDWKSDREGARIEELKIKVELVASEGGSETSRTA